MREEIMARTVDYKRIGRFAIFGAAGFGIGGVALGSLISAGPKVGFESGLGVLIAGLVIPFIGFAIAGAIGGAALGLALRKGGIIRLARFGVIAFLPAFLVLVVPLAIPWLFIGSANSEIYVTNLDGSNQANLTNSSNPDKYPAWSPDGNRIAFISQSKLHVMNADGSGQSNLLDSGYTNNHPAWSPDGNRIAFISRGDLYVMNADGSNQISLRDTGYLPNRPDWSPDGTSVAFSLFMEYPGIYIVNADGGNQTNLTAGQSNGDKYPAWSPDSSRIAFTRQSKLYVMNTDGSNQVKLTDSGYIWDRPAWSPDGTKIAFVRLGKLYTMNADGSNEINFTDSGNSDRYPTWSPDGTKIAYIGDGKLYVMNTDGSNRIELASKHTIAETDMYPAWSPDSTRIAFTSYGDYGDVVYVMKEVFGKYGFASAMIGASISIVLGAVLFKDKRRIIPFSLAGALGFGLGMVIIMFSPLDLWHARGYMLGGINAVLGLGVLGIIGGAFLGAALGYLEKR